MFQDRGTENRGAAEDVNAFRLCSLRPRIPLGRLLITPEAKAALEDSDIHLALYRHIRGDWGELDDADWKENDISSTRHLRLLSSYKAAAGTRFWIITEADRSATTILLPSDY